MATLHIGWFPQTQRFLLWGEAWKPLPSDGFGAWDDVHLHPYAIAQAELASLLTRLQQLILGKGETQTLLPPALMA
ncbi:MAG TPA: hypothetical protein IGR64_15580, partial [Leptolyngbyaceae cyanobacterium M65_K2018_010]|nr:hypothetical protein [Leptolyngbyaceae cyanobacterium M65_K2018_010]